MRRWVALAAAYLVVLQAIFAGLSSGANAASFSLDRSLAMSLCAGGEGPISPDNGAAAHEQPLCCAAGCTLTGGAPAAPDFLPIVHRPAQPGTFRGSPSQKHGFGGNRSPANPRAPPAA
jgi:hypothetical protein